MSATLTTQQNQSYNVLRGILLIGLMKTNLAFDEERFFLVTPCLRPETETSWNMGSLIQMMALKKMYIIIIWMQVVH